MPVTRCSQSSEVRVLSLLAFVLEGEIGLSFSGGGLPERHDKGRACWPGAGSLKSPFRYGFEI